MYDIMYTYDMILLVISYMISYHDIPGGSICSSSAAALAPPRRGSGLAATLPRLCGPDPALAETLSPDPLRLRDGHHPSAAPAVAPHPDVHLVEPATVAPVALCICRGISKARIVPEAVWNCRVTVAADEARNEGGAPKYVGHGADVEAGQAWVAGRIIEHGYTSLLHDTVWGQLNGLKCAEVHQGHLLVRVTEPFEACGTQGTVEKELRACIPHQTVPLQVKIGLDIEGFHRVRVVGEGRKYHHAILSIT